MDDLEKRLKELEEAELATKAQLLTLSERKEILETDYKLEFFDPHPKQMLFFEQWEKKRRAIFAGNRFGKTTLGIIEDICWMIGFRPFFPEGHPLRYAGIPKHAVKILVLALDWDTVKELFTNDGRRSDTKGKFFEWCPPNVIAGTERNSQGAICVIHTVSEVHGKLRRSSIFFDTVKSFKNDGLSHESKDWDVVHVDEPIPRELWIATSRGLIDRNGSSWWMLTPLSQPWMFNEMEEQSNNDLYWSIQASMDDNPTLTEEAKSLYLEQLDPIELDCRKRGVPLAFGNLVISTYNEEQHLWKRDRPPHGWEDWVTPPRDYYCAYAVDTHPQTPTAVLFVAIAPNEDVFIFHELWIGGIKKDRISRVCSEIRAITDRIRVGYELLEPAAWSEDPETAYRFVDTFEEHGLMMAKASKLRSYCIQKTRMLFASPRKVWVFPHLKVLRKELKSWYFDKENKPVDKDDHMCENLGRLIIHDDLRWYKEHVGHSIPFSDPRIDSYDSLNNELEQIAASY